MENQKDNFELFIWSSGWGVPSMDPESLQALANIRFAGLQCRVSECNNPWRSPNHSIPFFKKADLKYIYSPNEISKYLNSQNYSANARLDQKQIADSFAYAQYVVESLKPAYLFYFFIMENNFMEVIRPFYGSHLPWLYKLWYPNLMRNKGQQFIETIYGSDSCFPELLEPYILQKAIKCIKMLSDKLGSDEFFMLKHTPCTLDGLIYSYLAPVLNVPLPHSPLRDAIKATPNLERFIARISQRYFPVLASNKTSRIIYGPYGELKTSEEEEFPLKNKLFAVLTVAFAMLAYAYRIGLIKPTFGHQPQLELAEEQFNDEDWD